MRTIRSSCVDEEARGLTAEPAAAAAPLQLPAALSPRDSSRLVRMFRDSRLLKADERRELIAQLRSATEMEPATVELHVLLGMALSLDLQAQEGLEELRESVRRAPDCFVARLKFGELLMRLHNAPQAAEETQKAAQLASNAAQSGLAQRQAAEICTTLLRNVEV